MIRHLLIFFFTVVSITHSQMAMAKNELDLLKRMIPLIGSDDKVHYHRVLNLDALPAHTQDAIYKQFPNLKVGDFSLYDLDLLVDYLVTQEQFESVSIYKKADDSYGLNVGKTKRLSRIVFSGINNLSETDIRNEFALTEKSIYDQQSLLDAGERIRRFYRFNGFQNSVIDLDLTYLSATDIEVKVTVKEGQLTRIQNIEIKTDNPDIVTTFLKPLNRRLRKEPLTDNLIVSVKKEFRDDFSEQNYFKAELLGPEIKLNKDETEAQLVFQVSNSDQYFLDYKGNAMRTKGQIEKALELEHFYSSNPNIGPELSNRIKNYYLNEGYARVEITTEDGEGTKTYRKHLIFNINEGPRIKIDSIHFTGRFSLAEKYYSEFIKDHATELIADNYYNREGIELGVKNLIIDRQNQGFLKAKINSIKTIYQGSKKEKAAITISLEEGPLSLLSEVQFAGHSSFSDRHLLEVSGLNPHQPLKLNELDEAISKIKDFYHRSGYLEMYLINEREDLIKYNEDNTLATIHFKIYEGPKIIVSSILIEGNTLTKDYVILKELDFQIGDTLTPQLIEESTSRLQRLGFFNSIDIKTLEEKTQISQRTVIVKVNDRDPGLFNLGFGANNENEFTLRGYTGLAYRNIMGTGRGVSIRLEGNYNVTDFRYLERKITLGYLEPYLFDTRIRGRVSVTQSVFISNFKERLAEEVKQITYTAEQDLTSHIFLSYDIWSSAQLREFAIDTDNYKFSPYELVIVTTGPNVDIDFRDHPFNPSKGTFTRINAEYSSPDLGSSRTIQYLRAMGSFTHYKTVWKPGWVFANSMRGGYLRNLSTVGGVPYDQKGLVLGGQSTIRGFLPTESFPNSYEFGTNQYTLKHSASMYLIKSELRFPITGAVGGAFFYDGGAVFVVGDNLNMPDPYRHAVGGALRYATPVGAVSLELGYKLNQKEERRESQWPIFFSIGTF